MAPNYLHGIETLEVDDGARPIQTIKTGVIGLIGTAPARDTAKYAINTPYLVAGNQKVALEFGNLGTIPDALNSIFKQVGATVIVVVIEEGTSTNAAIKRLQTYANVVGNPQAKTGVHAFRKSNSINRITPKILIAPGFTGERPADGIASIAVNTGGTGYAQATTTATITGGAGQGAKAAVLVNGSTGVQAVILQSPGVGYKAGSAAATGAFNFTAQPAVGETLVVNGVTFTFIANGASPVGNQIALGTTLATTTTAIAAALNASANASVSVASYAATATAVNVTYKTSVDAGNTFTLSETVANGTVSGPTLTGGYGPIAVTITGAGTGATATPVIGKVANPTAVELATVAPFMRACVLVDTAGLSYEDAIAYRGDFDTDRVKIIEGGFQHFDANLAQNVVVPAAAFAAGKQAYMDQAYGFWWDFSNQPIAGVTGVGRPIEWSYFDQNVEGQLLNSNSVAVTVHDDGFKIMGVRVPTSDSNWMFWSVRRTADAVYEAIEYALRTAIDRPIGLALIDWIQLSVNDYLGILTNRGAILGGKAWLDPDQNPEAQLKAGQLVIDFDLEPPAPLERLTFRAHRNAGYYTELVNTVLVNIAQTGVTPTAGF